MRFDNSVKKLVLKQIKKKVGTCKIADNFGISRDTIRRWKNLVEIDENKQNSNYEKFLEIKKIDKENTRIYDYQAIKKFVDNDPSCTQQEIINQFDCSKGTVDKVLKNLGYTRKKKVQIRRARPSKSA
jgi:DNA invertase Pin-like site-specific DNA recombinase